MSLDLSSAATNLLSSLGTVGHVVIVNKSGGSFDPAAGSYTGQAETEQTPKAVVLSPKDSLVDGTRILSTDKIVICDNSATVTQASTIKIGTLEHRVVEIGGANPSGVQQYYRVVCRV